MKKKLKNFFKNQIKKFLSFLLIRENKNIFKLFRDFNIEINFLDIGAAGGIQNKWLAIKNCLNVYYVEPIQNQIINNKNKFKYQLQIKDIFYSQKNPIKK